MFRLNRRPTREVRAHVTYTVQPDCTARVGRARCIRLAARRRMRVPMVSTTCDSGARAVTKRRNYSTCFWRRIALHGRVHYRFLTRTRTARRRETNVTSVVFFVRLKESYGCEENTRRSRAIRFAYRVNDNHTAPPPLEMYNTSTAINRI